MPRSGLTQRRCKAGPPGGAIPAALSGRLPSEQAQASVSTPGTLAAGTLLTWCINYLHPKGCSRQFTPYWQLCAADMTAITCHDEGSNFLERKPHSSPQAEKTVKQWECINLHEYACLKRINYQNWLQIFKKGSEVTHIFPQASSRIQKYR